MKLRDFQRSKVYKAEKCIWGMGKPLHTVTDMQKYIDNCISIESLKELNLRITIKDGRGRRSACWQAIGKGIGFIKMPLGFRNEAVLLHELAHCLVNKEYERYSVHGTEFCNKYLMLVFKFMGVAAYNLLLDSYKKYNICFSI